MTDADRKKWGDSAYVLSICPGVRSLWNWLKCKVAKTVSGLSLSALLWLSIGRFRCFLD